MVDATSAITSATNWLTQSKPATLDPLEMVGKVQSIANAATSNRLMQQQILNEQQQLENSRLANEASQFKLNTDESNRARTLIFSVANKSDDDLKGGGPLYETLERENLRPEVKQALKSQIDQVTQAGGDQNGALYRPLMDRLFAPTMTPEEHVGFIRGKQVTGYTPSGQTQTYMVPGIGAQPGAQTQPLGSPYGGGLTPAEGTSLLTVRDSEGHSKQVPAQELRQYQLQGWTVGEGTRVQTPGALGGIGTTLPNDQEIKLATESKTQQLADTQYVTSPAFTGNQDALASILHLSPNVKTGTGTEMRNYAERLITNVSPRVAAFLHIDPTKVADQQELWKMMATAARAAGNRSDADLFQSMASTPNKEMDPRALQRTAAYLMAQNAKEFAITRQASSQATNLPLDLSTHYSNQRAKVLQSLDPTAFLHAYQPDSAEEAANYYDKLSPQGKQKYDFTKGLIQQLPKAGGIQ